MRSRRHVLAPLATLALLPGLAAQWPTSSSPNLPIGDATGEQTLAKIAATADGGCYVGWFDNRSGSYAVYLQRLDPSGAEQWPHGGILVSGQPQSTSLVDWDLLCDRQDHCVLAFTDTRAGGDLDVYAYRIAPNGTFVWGANGVTLSNNADYEADPRLCEAFDGDIVVVWPNSALHTIQMQRLDPNGTPRFPGDGIGIPGDTGATPGFARVAAGAPGTGDVVVSWVRTLAFTGNKHVHAQKFDAAGTALWNGGTRLAVFDQASVPIAHAPRLLADGSGGALLAWHFAVGNTFSVRVQHVAAGGSEVFPHDGVDVSGSANSKFDPAIVWQPATSELFVAWNERNVAQTTWGIFAQKFDAAGSRAFGNTGVMLLPIDTTVKFAPVAAPLGADGFAVSVLVESLGLAQKSVQVFGLDGTGALRWSPATLASTVPSDKLRLAHTTTASGTSLLAWTDQRTGSADVYAAAVDLAGGLGLTLAANLPYGCGGNPAGSLTGSPRPGFGQSITLRMTNPLASQPASSLGFFFWGIAPAPGFPCGPVLPGFGMAGPGQPGELLVDLASPYVALFGGVWGGIPNTLTNSYVVPFAPGLAGQSLYVQGLMVDLAAGANLAFGLTNGLQVRIGS